MQLHLHHVDNAITSPIFRQVTERIIRQLLESLLYEQVVQPVITIEGEKLLFAIEGTDATGCRVEYRCKGRRTITFGRIKLDRNSIIRVVRGSAASPIQPDQVLLELMTGCQQGVEQSKLLAMATELEQTRLKDVLAQYEREQQGIKLNGLTYDELESAIMDGHPYHPCYKSRMGFNYIDNYNYGPEFKQPIFPLWAALEHGIAKASIAGDSSFEELMQRELGEAQIAFFKEKLLREGCNPANYIWLPVHPWQWVNKIVPSFMPELHSKQIVLLGSSQDSYAAQQSIRTLSNALNPAKPSVKLSLHIRNTSSVRLLKPHSVVSAPTVSHWLSELAAKDEYLKNEAGVIILKEFAGVTYESKSDELARDQLSQARYGALGCIWRESIHMYLEDGEQAVPFHALYALEADQTAFIDCWIKQYGIGIWLQKLLEASMLPIVHLLVIHGIALESHAQNMILIHKDGLPVRVALKDFHEGVEYCSKEASELVPPPNFAQIHPVYAQGDLDDYYEMKDHSSLVAMTLDAFFMINLGELALLLSEKYKYDEQTFWQLAVTVLRSHQAKYVEQQERFDKFNLYSPTCPVEQLANSRLQAEAVEHCHTVDNPLFVAKTALDFTAKREASEHNGEELIRYATS